MTGCDEIGVKYISNIFEIYFSVKIPTVPWYSAGRIFLSRTEGAANAETFFMRWWSIEVYQCDIILGSHRGMGHFQFSIFNFQFSLPPSDFALPPFMRGWSIEVYQCDIFLSSYSGRRDIFFISHRERRGRRDIFYDVVSIDVYQCDIILGSHRGRGHFQFSIFNSHFLLPTSRFLLHWW
jgi:hypothetical protein